MGAVKILKEDVDYLSCVISTPGERFYYLEENK